MMRRRERDDAGAGTKRKLSALELFPDGPTTKRGAAGGDAGGASTSRPPAAAGRRSVELPLHLTERILRRISPLESARLAAVCKAWAATVSERLARLSPHLFVAEVGSSMLLRASGRVPDDPDRQPRAAIISVPLDGGGVPSPAVIAARANLSGLVAQSMRCMGAMPSGRLAFSCPSTSSFVFLAHPVTDAVDETDAAADFRCQKPVLVTAAGAGGGHGRSTDAFFSDDSCGDNNMYRPPLTLSRWRDGGAGWSTCAVLLPAALEGLRILSAAAGRDGGCIYVLHNTGRVAQVDAGGSPPPLRMEMLPAASLVDHVRPPGHRFLSPTEGHLTVSDDGELLFVRKLHELRPVASTLCRRHEFYDIAGFEVYRMDVSGRRWTRVETLPEDTAMFVSRESIMAVRASRTEGCRSNCVYFVNERQSCVLCRQDGGCSWGVYSMEDAMVVLEQGVTSAGSNTEMRWFLPCLV
ncbi:hypothetical protein ACP4OV_010072 [Aristida adscensionis]